MPKIWQEKVAKTWTKIFDIDLAGQLLDIGKFWY
jgi:hypothetical protein